MNRGGPLRRVKPLTSSTPLQRVTPLSSHQGKRPRASRAKSARSTRLSGADPLWPAAREVALQRDGYSCVICGTATREVNHRVPRGMGGRMNDPDRHSPDRLISLCRDHHHAAEVVERGKAYTIGLFVPAGRVAALWPVKTRHGWVQLTSLGTRHPISEARAKELQAA